MVCSTWNFNQGFKIWASAQLKPFIGCSATRFKFIKFGRGVVRGAGMWTKPPSLEYWNLLFLWGFQALLSPLTTPLNFGLSWPITPNMNMRRTVTAIMFPIDFTETIMHWTTCFKPKQKKLISNQLSNSSNYRPEGEGQIYEALLVELCDLVDPLV